MKWSSNWDTIVHFLEDAKMAGKREKPGDIVLKLWQVEVLQGQGKSVQEAVRQIAVTVQTHYRWRKEYGAMALTLKVVEPS